MKSSSSGGTQKIYAGEGDRLMEQHRGDTGMPHITVLPDARPVKAVDPRPKIRIMWGQHLLDDLAAGRYRSLVCGVNATDNSHGIIGQLASVLPTSQWKADTITKHAQLFAAHGRMTVIKFDMDAVQVLALLRPAGHETLTLDDVAAGFKIVGEMLARRSEWQPCASVSFLGGRANALRERDGREPAFEQVLRTMHEAGFTGDVYPATWMWESETPVFARYPFPPSLESMRHGGS